ISPYFPPVNAADMQRVRMSLPYFRDLGWEAEVVCVDPVHAEMQVDHLLCESVPEEIPVHFVSAFAKKYTGKIGLGSIALRSLWFYRKKVNTLLKKKNFDLVYFSTTQFPVCILGAYWKKKFGVPYVIDMQDPWHSDYYLNKPKNQRPPKYWFSYRLNKWLEPIAMKAVGGLISVSDAYLQTLKKRYSAVRAVPCATIPFSAFTPDQHIAEQHKSGFNSMLDRRFVNIVYVGRGGADMRNAVLPLFSALQKGLNEERDIFRHIRINFIGTSYAPAEIAKPSIKPLADAMGLQDYVVEITQRIGFYHALATLQEANALFVPGSDDSGYTASKIYPYILTKRPLLAIFHPDSSVTDILMRCSDALVLNLLDDRDKLLKNAYDFLHAVASRKRTKLKLNSEEITKIMAPEMTMLQVGLFNQLVH
ncbi:MAG: glycosyltransferase, partial [Mucilaginibacter polytrichastri]|nr:glycosyltransferase [Mucilaginibacter polytrichastri]